jgi:protein involved in polysaccharide export with SLBB domain
MLRHTIPTLVLITLASCQSKTPPTATTNDPAQPASYTLAGNVPHPGPRALNSHESVVSALTAAGFNHDTRPWPNQVALRRPAKNGQPKATAVIDVRQMLQSGDMKQNYLIEPGDTLYVPAQGR